MQAAAWAWTACATTPRSVAAVDRLRIPTLRCSDAVLLKNRASAAAAAHGLGGFAARRLDVMTS